MRRKIYGNLETLQAVLAFAPEIEAFHGKESQFASYEFSRSVKSLAYELLGQLPPSQIDPDYLAQESEKPPSSEDIFISLEVLAHHAFERVQGPKTRSSHSAELRGIAWETLALIARVLRRPAHLAHALAVTMNNRASEEERDGAIRYLLAYWEDEEPDEKTVLAFQTLEEDPPSREFLVSVLQAQIDLGLSNEFAALAATGDWDDAHEDD